MFHIIARTPRRPVRPALAAVGLLMAASLGACAEDEDNSDGLTPPAEKMEVVANVPDGELTKADTLQVCSNVGTPPAIFYNEEQELGGYDLDISQQIAGRLGLQLEIVPSVFDTIIAAVQTGKCNLIVSDMFITPEREKEIAFVPYLSIGEQFLVKSDAADNLPEPSPELSELCGFSATALTGGVELERLKAASQECEAAGSEPIDVIAQSTNPTALQALATGKADAFFTDYVTAVYYAEQDSSQFALKGEVLNRVEAGIGIPSDHTQTQNSVQAALDDMKSDGTYAEILKSWDVESLALD